MSTVPTIAYMEQEQERGQKVLTFLNEQDEVLDDLTGLQTSVEQSTDAEVEQVAPSVEFALESLNIRRLNSVNKADWIDSSFRRELSMEAAPGEKAVADRPSVLKRIWDMLVRMVKAITKSLKRVWDWVVNIIAKSKVRRDFLIKQLKGLIKEAQTKENKRGVVFTANVSITEEQRKFFSVDGKIAESQGAEVAKMTLAMREYRNSEGLRLAISSILTLDSQTLGRTFGKKEIDFNYLFARVTGEDLEKVNKRPWITPEKHIVYDGAKDIPNTTAQIALNILGNKSIVRFEPINYNESIQRTGYDLVESENAERYQDPTDSMIRFESLSVLIDQAKVTIDLLEELELSSRSMREVRKVVDTVVQLDNTVNGVKVGDQAPKGAEAVMAGLRVLNATTRSLVAFPSAMFSHGVVIASAQASLLKHAMKLTSAS